MEKLYLDGEDITDYDINHRANAGIGYAFQQPPRFKGMTVMKTAQACGKGRAFGRRDAVIYLTAVGLCAKDYIYRQIDGTLSGGEMKRIEIASVLAKEHSLCIFRRAGGRNRSVELLYADSEVRGDSHREKSRALS